MKMVNTIHGLMPRDALVPALVVRETDNTLEIATEWRVIGPNGVTGDELVRRDLQVIFLRPPEDVAVAAALGAAAVAVPPSPPGADVTVGLAGQALQGELAKLA